MRVLFQRYGVLQGKRHLFGAEEVFSSELTAFYLQPSRLSVSDIKIEGEWVTVTRAITLSGVNTEWTEILFPSPEAAQEFAASLTRRLTEAVEANFPPKSPCEDMFDEIFGEAETIDLGGASG